MSSQSTTILDIDQPRPIIVESDETPEIVLPLIVLIVLIFFLGWMLYLLISSGFKTTSPSDPVTSDTRTETSIMCAPGQCATNLQSGFKSCPTGNVSITVNPTESVCNNRFVCDNPLTPYAVQSDSSTNINGVCEPNTECPCLRVSQCPNYILSVFTTSNGNPYEPLPGQRVTFPQQSTYVAINGVQTDTPPIQFTNPATTFCAASLAFLPLSSPGCNFVSAPDGNSMTYEDLIFCFGLQKGCSGAVSSPCLQGTLAAISSDPDNLTRANILTSQFACVRGESCPCGQATIFDTNFGAIVCRELN
jgi:hypothetical protein